MESMNGTDATAYSSIKKYSVKLSLSPLTWWLGNFRFGYIILNLWGPWVQNYIWVVVHPPPMKVLLKQKLVSEVLISILANVHVLCKGPKFFIRLCAKVPLPKMCDNKVCSNSWFQGKPAFNERWWIIFGKNQLLRMKCFEGLNLLGVEIYFEVKNTLKKEKLCDTLWSGAPCYHGRSRSIKLAISDRGQSMIKNSNNQIPNTNLP